MILVGIPALFCCNIYYFLLRCFTNMGFQHVTTHTCVLVICHQILRKGPLIYECASKPRASRTPTEGITVLHQVGIERTLAHILHELLYRTYILGTCRLKISIDPEDQIDIGDAIYHTITLISQITSME